MHGAQVCPHLSLTDGQLHPTVAAVLPAEPEGSTSVLVFVCVCVGSGGGEGGGVAHRFQGNLLCFDVWKQLMQWSAAFTAPCWSSSVSAAGLTIRVGQVTWLPGYQVTWSQGGL